MGEAQPQGQLLVHPSASPERAHQPPRWATGSPFRGDANTRSRDQLYCPKADGKLVTTQAPPGGGWGAVYWNVSSAESPASILELSASSNSEAAHCLLALLPETARGPNVRQPQDGDGGGGQVPRARGLRAQPLMTGPAAVTPQPLRLARPAVVHFNDVF